MKFVWVYISMSASFQDLIVICAATVPAVSVLFSKFWLNLFQRLWFENIKMDTVDRLAVETQRPEIVLNTGSRSAPKITSFGYDVPECPTYKFDPAACATSVSEITNETPNVPVVHSTECDRSRSEGSICTCSASGSSGGGGNGPGAGMTYAVVHASDYKPPVCGCMSFTAYDVSSEEVEEEEKREMEQKREPQEKRGSQVSRNGKGGDKKKKKVSFSDGGGDDDEKMLDYVEMEPEPVCEKPYCPLFHQLIILAVLIVLLSLAVAFHTIHEFMHPKKYALPVNISVYHNSLNY